MSTFDERFAALCPDLTPLGVQRQAATALSRSGRALATLPTGSGKTLLAALPFAAGLMAPKQMVFATPLRTLTDAQTRTLQASIQAAAASEFLGVPWSVKPQTGTAPEDPLFTAAAVVCTFDQALSSALSIAYSTSRGRRGINAGAVLTSYLVCDELHLFPRDEALTTLLWLLRHRPDLPFLLMTATLSQPIAAELARLLDAEVLTDLSGGDRDRLGLAERSRTVTWDDAPLDVARVLAAAAASPDGRAIVVVNTVERARALGAALAEQLGWERVLVLHSRFLPEHRAQIEQRLAATMGKGTKVERTPAVLVATQVVEVGLDISAGAMLTEWAPANALVQRWGRCARWGGEGTVVVAPPSADGDELPLPYTRETGMAEVLTRTRVWLRAQGPAGVLMTDATERALLDAAHAETDARWIGDLERRLHERAHPIGEAIGLGTYSHAGGLIRRIDNRTVLLHGDPSQLTAPARSAGFSLASGTVRGLTRRGIMADTPRVWSDEDDEGDLVSLGIPADAPWVLQKPVWSEERGERRAGTPIRGTEATAADVDAESIFALNPAVVSYDPRLGLGLTPGEPVSPDHWSPLVGGRAGVEFGLYRRETYAAHVARMLAVLDRRAALWPTVGAVAATVEAWCGWPGGMLFRLTRSAILLHDAGKLTDAWQGWAREYQAKACHPYDQWLVHTDEQPGLRLPTPGQHALTGAAYAVALGQALDDEVSAWRAATDSPRREEDVLPSRVLFTAIATHHGAQPHTGTTMIGRSNLLTPSAIDYLSTVLRDGDVADIIETPLTGQPHHEHCVTTDMLQGDSGQDAEYLALATVSRLLRLADGWSQEASEEQTGDVHPTPHSPDADDAAARPEADRLPR